MLLLNVPSNNLNIGAVDIVVYADKDLKADGTLTLEQWAALMAIIAPFLPPPVGTKTVGDTSAPAVQP